jgi:hypothetical protein
MPQTIMPSLTVIIYMTSVTLLSFYMPYRQSHKFPRKLYSGKYVILTLVDPLIIDLEPTVESIRRLDLFFIYTKPVD